MTSEKAWVLAFDGSCGACRGISQAVEAGCGDLVQVLPLRHPEVTEWRRQAFTEDPPWAPTLLRVSGGDVHAWTGVRLSIRLAGVLGPRSTLRVIRALGELRVQSAEGRVVSAESLREEHGLSRKAFLRRLGLGAAMVGGILVSGSIPASANPVDKWKEANAGKLPTQYSQLRSLPMEYRRAAYQELTPSQQSAAWVGHLKEVIANRPNPTPAQQNALTAAQQLASSPSTFTEQNTDQVQKIGEEIRQAFGAEDGAQIIATLGPSVATALPYCSCATFDSWCSRGYSCIGYSPPECKAYTGGCGSLWVYSCDGLCYSS